MLVINSASPCNLYLKSECFYGFTYANSHHIYAGVPISFGSYEESDGPTRGRVNLGWIALKNAIDQYCFPVR